ncbi:hypothetical protein NVP1244A_042 [Vibrio phage 1.244.A._10N.261.54.C3]|nr:hypothetical protein NVP1244A_042 [Vibrio phage 1.244.A._10N.261.54.C3]AUR98670.1 hypothetical protein NVP1255O_042 [Vibrio phage 1.255.O._10N.286.45.F1]
MITRFEVDGIKLVMNGGLQDNTNLAVIPNNRTQEVLKWLDGAVDEYGIPMMDGRFVPAGVGLHLTKIGKTVNGFYPEQIKARDPDKK